MGAKADHIARQRRAEQIAGMFLGLKSGADFVVHRIT
jgi:hypothetical protein